MKRFIGYIFILALLLASCTPQISSVSEFSKQPPSEDDHEPASSDGQRAPIIPVPASVNATAKEKCSQGDLSSSLLFWVPKYSDWALTPLDPASGLPLCTPEPIHFGEVYFQAISPDRSLLAVVDYQMQNDPSGQLKFVDLSSWEVISTSSQIEGWINRIAFDPTSSKLAIAYDLVDEHQNLIGYTLMQIDVAQPSNIDQVDLGIMTSFLAYTDRGELVAFGAPFDPSTNSSQMPVRVLVYSAADLSQTWDASIPGLNEGTFRIGKGNEPLDFTQWHSAVALDPIQARLYVAHADQDYLTTVDLSQREVKTVEIQAKQGYLERLLTATAGVAHAKMLRGTFKEGKLSEDGSRLFVAGYSGDPIQDKNGNFEYNLESLDLQVIETSSGRELERASTPASQVEVVPGLPMLLLRGWDMEKAWTDVLDLETLTIKQHIPDRMVQVARLVNGDPLILSFVQDNNSSQVAILDPATLSISYQYEARGYYIDLR